MLAGEHAAGAAHAGLHLVGDEQHAMLLCQRAQPLMELRRRYHVAALALDGLHEHRRDLIGRYEMDEDLVFDEVEALGGARFRFQAERTAVAVRIRRMEHAGQHRTEAAPLYVLARRDGQRAERAAVKRAQERNEVESLAGVPGQLDGSFDGFRTGVAEERPDFS